MQQITIKITVARPLVFIFFLNSINSMTEHHLYPGL